MVTGRMSYSLHCDVHADHRMGPLYELSRLHIDTKPPALYVAMATWIPKCNMYNVESDHADENIETGAEAARGRGTEEIENDAKPGDRSIDLTSDSDDKPCGDNKKDSDLDVSQEIDFDDSQDDAANTSRVSVESEPRKRSSSRTPIKGLSKEERAKIKQQEREEKAKVKQEKEEQKLKEKKEKEELKLKEKKEKEEQKRKDREEKEELKRKEREEKEEQKRKEKEEREELKRKEKEEKEELKRKEREQKELQKQQILEGKNKKHVKESAAFVNFFVPRKSSTDLRKPDPVSSYFKAFEVKSDMRLAPLVRTRLSSDQKQCLVDKLQSQDDDLLYLKEIKYGKLMGKGMGTWPVVDEEVVVVEDTDIGESIKEESTQGKLKAKLLKFHENRRPAYFGTWRKKSKHITARKPFLKDGDVFDYEVDSDDDWEEEEPGESLRGSDDEDKEEDPDDIEYDNFMVPHGYLSDGEGDDDDKTLTPEMQKEKLKVLQIEFELERNSKTEKLKPRLIGCIFETKLEGNTDEAMATFLDDRMFTTAGPVVITKRDSTTPRQNSASKSTPSRRLLTRELVPEFLQLIHGNTNNKSFLVNEFLSHLAAKKPEVSISKAGLCQQLKQLAKWTKCPDEGVMHNKYCWFVNEDVRNQYNLNLQLPNKWTYATSDDSNVGAKRNLVMS